MPTWQRLAALVLNARARLRPRMLLPCCLPHYTKMVHTHTCAGTRGQGGVASGGGGERGYINMVGGWEKRGTRGRLEGWGARLLGGQQRVKGRDGAAAAVA